MNNIIWIIISVLTGVAYAWLLYSKKAPWSNKINYSIAFARFILVAFMMYLIFAPVINQISSIIDKPIVVIAIDDSKSMTVEKNSKSLLEKLAKQVSEIKKNGVEVQLFSFGKTLTLDSLSFLKFERNKTDISDVLSKIDEQFESQNLTSVVLLSDGIYNTGYSPIYNQFNFKLHTIAVGDTIARKDLILKNVLYNKISGIGTVFPIVVEVKNIGFKGQSIIVQLKEGATVLASKTIMVNSDNGIQTIEFQTTAKQKGLHHYKVEITSLKEEYSLKNNISHIYIDALDNKQKVLIVGAFPHPDIKAMVAALGNNSDIDVLVYIPGINEYKDLKYDMVVFNQIPNMNNVGNDLLETFIKKSVPILFILGGQSNISKLNSINTSFKILAQNNQFDKVTAEINTSFNRFTMNDDARNAFKEYPPLLVPFGEFNLPNWDYLLFQKVGTVPTAKPLIAIKLETNATLGLIAGEGIWQWRISEANSTDKTISFDTFFQKIVQLLAKKEDKSHFRFTPALEEFTDNEKIVFNTESYNELYEKVYGNDIQLKIKSEEGKQLEYTFNNNESNSRFEIAGLETGIYKYTALTELNSKQEIVKGEFLVSLTNLEEQNTMADRELMRQLASKNSGQSLLFNQIDELSGIIIKSNPKGKVHSIENMLELINLKWIFFILLFVISLEWIFRKINGGY